MARKLLILCEFRLSCSVQQEVVGLYPTLLADRNFPFCISSAVSLPHIYTTETVLRVDTREKYESFGQAHWFLTQETNKASFIMILE